MTRFHPGMRVVVADGPWPLPRAAGHYGKVTAVASLETAPMNLVQVDITGHIDGEPVLAIVREIGLIDWFNDCELEVVD